MRKPRFVKTLAIVAIGLVMLPSSAATGPRLRPAKLIDAAGTSPYVHTPESQLPGQPEWQRSYEQGLDRAVEVGYGWIYFSLTWSSIQDPLGTIDLSGLDKVVEAAHDRGVRLVIDLQTCDFSLPQPPTLTGGGYRNNSMHGPLPSCAPKDITAPIGAWSAVAARYAPGGGLARDRRWTDDYSVDHYEIENEPNSLPWIHGNWGSVPKDYALFLSKLGPAMKAANPRVRILAPALEQSAEALDWLDRILDTDPATMEWASDDYRADVAAGREKIVGAGPFIDAYSYHEDFPDPASSVLVDRPAEIRKVVARHAGQVTYPTSTHPILWFTEGDPANASGKDVETQRRWSWGSAQLAFHTLGSGVSFVDQNFSTSNMDASEDFQKQPGYAMAKTFLEFFPVAEGITPTTKLTTAAAGRDVFSYTWTNPRTKLRSMVMWAKTFRPAPGAPSDPEFMFELAIDTTRAIFVGSDWTRKAVNTPARKIGVTLRGADPSPVVMVIEQR